MLARATHPVGSVATPTGGPSGTPPDRSEQAGPKWSTFHTTGARGTGASTHGLVTGQDEGGHDGTHDPIRRSTHGSTHRSTGLTRGGPALSGLTRRTGAAKPGADALQPLARTSLHELVAQRVLSHIVQHDLAEGDRIPGERELARRLAVSRSSVRQAIAGLTEAGVLASRHGGGTYVVRLDLDSEPLASVAVRRAHLPSVHEARRILEVPAAALAATRRTSDDLDAIGRALELMASEIAAGEVGARGDAAFHAAVTAAAQNPTLRDLMGRIEDDVVETRSESLSQTDRPPRSLDDHRRIAAAIQQQDPAAAAAAMQRHLDRVADVRLLTWSPR